MTPLRIAHVTTIDMTLSKLLMGQLIEARDRGHSVTGISAPGPWTPALQAQGIRHIPWVNATRSWDPRRDLRAFTELYRLIKREAFDVVHLHNPKPGILGRIAARSARVPCVVNTVHGYYATPEDRLRKRAIVMGLEAIASRFSHLELFQSEEDLAWARRLRIVSERDSDLIGNGTDLAACARAMDPSIRQEARAELGIAPDAIVVGTIGRMVAEKGYAEFFEAAHHIHGKRPNVRFLAIGDIDPAKRDSLDGETVDRARADVSIAGWREDIPRMLAAMDIFVLASWREGVPRAAIEAAAAGKALVLTDIRGCREVIRDGVEGYLVPPRRPDQLAAAVLRLVDDEAGRRRMGGAARIRAIERFDEGRVARRVADHYERLLNVQASARSGVKATAGGA